MVPDDRSSFDSHDRFPQDSTHEEPADPTRSQPSQTAAAQLPFHRLQFRQLRALAMRQLPSSPTNSRPTTPKPLPPQPDGPRPEPAKITSVPSRSLRTKVTLWALGVSVLPVLLVGLGTYGTYRAQLGTGETTAQVQKRMANLWSPLLVGTGVTALVAGVIATLLARRTLRPVLDAAQSSTTLVNRLQREETVSPSHNEVQRLTTNLELIGQQLPSLLATRQEEAQKLQAFTAIVQQFQTCQTEEDLFNTAARATRQALKADRVGIFRFNSSGEGTFVAEDVTSGWAKLLWSTIEDPCFDSSYNVLYQEGRVRAIDNIYTADLSDCHIGLLEQFGVQANLIAPIHKESQLFGLLIAHQCSGPRVWQATEIELVTQIAHQISVAVDSVNRVQQLNTQAEQTHRVLTVSRGIRMSLDEEDVLNTTVTEVRKSLRADRVVVYTFDENWYGTVMAESVLPGFPKALWAEIHDPCFDQGFVQKYQAGYVHAIDDIQAANLGECYQNQLEAYEVKANLVAPILKDSQLFGLLIAHQCSGPRHWPQNDQDFIAQIALQVGYALDHARLTARIDAEEQNTRLLKKLAQRIRASLIEEDILSTTVTEMRKALKADRVIIYGFDAHWYGTVVAEAVLPGFTKAIWAEIKDPCFAEGFVKQYQSGRVHSLSNVQTAEIGECYRQQLEQFGVRANLVAPILKDEQLFGLLIAHQCSDARQWEPAEIKLITQVALQVGYALDQARLLAQVEQTYQLVQGHSHQQQQEKDALQQQIEAFLGEAPVQHLAEQTRQQMVSVSTLYNQVKAIATSTQGLVRAFEQGEQHGQQVSQTLQVNRDLIEQVQGHITQLQATFSETSAHLQTIEQPAQQLNASVQHITALAAQVKLQAMNITLESARIGTAGQDFATIGEQIHALSRQLESGLTDIQPLVDSVCERVQQTSAFMASGQQQILTGTQSVTDLQQQLGQIAAANYQLLTLIEQMNQAATEQAQQSELASQAAVAVANQTNQTAETSATIVASFGKLTSSIQEG